MGLRWRDGEVRFGWAALEGSTSGKEGEQFVGRGGVGLGEAGVLCG